MHVVPSVRVQESTPQRRFELKARIQRRSTGCGVLNGMMDLEAMQAEFRERPVRDGDACICGDPSTTERGKHSVCNLGEAKFQVNASQGKVPKWTSRRVLCHSPTRVSLGPPPSVPLLNPRTSLALRVQTANLPLLNARLLVGRHYSRRVSRSPGSHPAVLCHQRRLFRIRHTTRRHHRRNQARHDEHHLTATERHDGLSEPQVSEASD
jgi:hypothetical protein